MQVKMIGWIYKDEAVYLTFIKEKFKLAQNRTVQGTSMSPLLGFSNSQHMPNLASFLAPTHPSYIMLKHIPDIIAFPPKIFLYA